MTTLNDIALKVMDKGGWNDLLEFTHALIAELDAQGWQLVPKEPTERIKIAYTKCRTTVGEKWAEHQYKAMLAAAPKITEVE